MYAHRFSAAALGSAIDRAEAALHVVDPDARLYVPGDGYRVPDDPTASSDGSAVAVVTVRGAMHLRGEGGTPRPLHSAFKPFGYGRALEDRGTELRNRFGVRPVQKGFGARDFDDPPHPCINAGALLSCALVRGRTFEHRRQRILKTMRDCAGSELELDEPTFRVEIANAGANQALAYHMIRKGYFFEDPEKVLRLYLASSSVSATCWELAYMAATLANAGVNPKTRKRALSPDTVREVVAGMWTGGLYQGSRDWAGSVGQPAKSGVSGFILMVVPGSFGVAAFSPGLDPWGNSLGAARACEAICRELNLPRWASIP